MKSINNVIVTIEKEFETLEIAGNTLLLIPDKASRLRKFPFGKVISSPSVLTNEPVAAIGNDIITNDKFGIEIQDGDFICFSKRNIDDMNKISDKTFSVKYSDIFYRNNFESVGMWGIIEPLEPPKTEEVIINGEKIKVKKYGSIEVPTYGNPLKGWGKLISCKRLPNMEGMAVFFKGDFAYPISTNGKDILMVRYFDIMCGLPIEEYNEINTSQLPQLGTLDYATKHLGDLKEEGEYVDTNDIERKATGKRIYI